MYPSKTLAESNFGIGEKEPMCLALAKNTYAPAIYLFSKCILNINI